MVTGNVLQTLIELIKKLFVILFVWQKGFNRQGPDEWIEIEEDVLTVKWSSNVYRNLVI